MLSSAGSCVMTRLAASERSSNQLLAIYAYREDAMGGCNPSLAISFCTLSSNILMSCLMRLNKRRNMQARCQAYQNHTRTCLVCWRNRWIRSLSSAVIIIANCLFESDGYIQIYSMTFLTESLLKWHYKHPNPSEHGLQIIELPSLQNVLTVTTTFLRYIVPSAAKLIEAAPVYSPIRDH